MTPTPRNKPALTRRLVTAAVVVVITVMAISSACTRHGPAISVAAPLIAYLALGAHLIRHHRHRSADRAEPGRR